MVITTRSHHLKTLVLVISLAAVLFGASGFAMAGLGMAVPCPFAAAMGPDCSSKTVPGAKIMHHIDMMLQFSLATFVPIILAFAAVLAIALGGAWPSPGLTGAFIAERSVSSAHPERYKTASPLRRALFWSALHTRSADPAPAWVRGLAAIS